MRAALCLSGIVGRLYTQKSGYEWENDIDFRIGHYYYKKNILDVNKNVDVFIFCWKTSRHFRQSNRQKQQRAADFKS